MSIIATGCSNFSEKKHTQESNSKIYYRGYVKNMEGKYPYEKNSEILSIKDITDNQPFNLIFAKMWLIRAIEDSIKKCTEFEENPENTEGYLSAVKSTNESISIKADALIGSVTYTKSEQENSDHKYHPTLKAQLHATYYKSAQELMDKIKKIDPSTSDNLEIEMTAIYVSISINHRTCSISPL